MTWQEKWTTKIEPECSIASSLLIPNGLHMGICLSSLIVFSLLSDSEPSVCLCTQVQNLAWNRLHLGRLPLGSPSQAAYLPHELRVDSPLKGIPFGAVGWIYLILPSLFLTAPGNGSANSIRFQKNNFGFCFAILNKAWGSVWHRWCLLLHVFILHTFPHVPSLVIVVWNQKSYGKNPNKSANHTFSLALGQKFT